MILETACLISRLARGALKNGIGVKSICSYIHMSCAISQTHEGVARSGI